MASGSFPRPYLNSVPEEDSDPIMKAVPKKHTDIGARVSGTPKGMSNSNSIEHVGGSATGKR